MLATSPVVTSLAERILQLKAQTEGGQMWISISGAPGSGKSSLANQLKDVLPNAIVVPMDGFHYYKTHLASMPDPDLAFARRGAEWTFDSKKFVNMLRKTRKDKHGTFPSFDHSIGDPLEEDIQVSTHHDFVIVEGLYLLLAIPPWNEVKDMMDLSVFVNAEPDVLKSRLISRHMQCFHFTKQEAEDRAENNDIPNSIEIIQNKNRADIIVDNSVNSSAADLDIDILRIEPEDWLLLKEVRLQALRDAPKAFGTPLSAEASQPDEFWQARALNDEVGTFVAVGKSSASASAVPGARKTEDCLGLITGAPAFHREGTQYAEGAAGLYSMWVAEAARRRKVGRALVDRVKQWARDQDCYTKLLLIAGDFNIPAIRLYESCGFKSSGDPFDCDDELPEKEYFYPLS